MTPEQPVLDLTESSKRELTHAPDSAAPANVLEAIMRAASDPRIDVDKLERLLAMQERMEANQRKQAFDSALARAQAKMPQLDQKGVIDYGAGKGKIPYALMEDIDLVIRPIYTAEGFGVRWTTEPIFDGKLVKTTGYFSCAGHTETSSMATPPDTSGGKNGVQAVPSANSYNKRQITKNFWNLIEKGKDKDGSTLKKITREQSDTLRSALEAVDANIAGFCELMEVQKLEDMHESQLEEAYRAIEKKKTQRAAKGGVRR